MAPFAQHNVSTKKKSNQTGATSATLCLDPTCLAVLVGHTTGKVALWHIPGLWSLSGGATTTTTTTTTARTAAEGGSSSFETVQAAALESSVHLGMVSSLVVSVSSSSTDAASSTAAGAGAGAGPDVNTSPLALSSNATASVSVPNNEAAEALGMLRISRVDDAFLAGVAPSERPVYAAVAQGSGRPGPHPPKKVVSSGNAAYGAAYSMPALRRRVARRSVLI